MNNKWNTVGDRTASQCKMSTYSDCDKNKRATVIHLIPGDGSTASEKH